MVKKRNQAEQDKQNERLSAQGKGKVIVHGYNELFLINPAIKVFLNGQKIGKVKRGCTLEIPIEERSELRFKCGLRKSSRITIENAKETEVQLSWKLSSGKLVAETLSVKTSELKKLKEKTSITAEDLERILEKYDKRHNSGNTSNIAHIIWSIIGIVAGIAIMCVGHVVGHNVNESSFQSIPRYQNIFDVQSASGTAMGHEIAINAGTGFTGGVVMGASIGSVLAPGIGTILGGVIGGAGGLINMATASADAQDMTLQRLKAASYSTSPDWDSYCSDVFPGNDAYSRAARESCANSAESTEGLMNGRYNR